MIEPNLPERYEPMRLLGEGGMGRVLLVKDLVLNDEVALKELRAAKTPAEREAQLFVFQAEVRAAASLVHPRVVPLYDAGTLRDGSPYYTMRYLSGGSLLQFCAAPPPWALISLILDQLLEGLAFAHARGVVHRDIKPHNVLLERRDGVYEAFLADLSLVRPFGTSSKSNKTSIRRTTGFGSIAGTPAYMAPEQYDDEGRDIGPWTDLYAVGVMIFELVAGVLPFDGENIVEMVYAKGTKKAPTLVPRPGYCIPEGLAEIVAALLDRHPGSRFELAADVRAALRVLGPAEVTSQSASFSALTQANHPTLLGDEDEVAQVVEVAARLSVSDDELVIPRLPMPTPLAFPAQFVPDPGRGAPTRASLALYAYRRPPVLGREVLQVQLWELIKEALQGKLSRLVLLEGEAGAGKSRLARWLSEVVETLGVMRVIRIQDESATPMSGLDGALFRLIGGYGMEKLALKNRLHAYLVAREPVPPAPSDPPLQASAPNPQLEIEAQSLWRWLSPANAEDLPPLEERNVLFTLAVLRAAWRGATFLWFDDVAPSQVSEPFISHLIEAAHTEGKVLFIVVTPHAGESESRASLYEKLAARVDVSRLWVPPLSDPECRELVDELLDLSPKLREFVVTRSEGNPLYATQLISHWVEAQLLSVDPRSGSFGLLEGVDERRLLPPSMAELFRSRAAEVIKRASDPEATQEALQLAALLGSSFAWHIFNEALESRIGAERAKRGAWTAIASGLLKPSNGGRAARFEHALQREVIAEEASRRSDAPVIRRHLAQILERRAVDLEALLQAAEQWEAAGEGKRASQAYLRAAQSSFRLDIKRASWALRRALSLVEHEPGILPAKIHIELARACRLEGQPDLCFTHANAALSREFDQQIEAGAYLELGQLSRQKLEMEKALIEFGKADNAAKLANDKKLRTRALLGLGDIAFTRGDLSTALSYFIQGKELAALSNDPFLSGRVSNRVGDVYRAQNDMARAAGHYGEARMSSSQRGDRLTELNALSGLGDVAMATGDLEGAKETFEAAYQLARLANFQEGLLAQVLNLAALYLEMRQPDQAILYLAEGESYLEKGSHWAKPLLHLVSAWGEAMRQKPQHALERLQTSKVSGLAKYHDSDAARAAEGCGDEAVALSPKVASVAYSIALEQFASLGRNEDFLRVNDKLKQLPT
jgi:eukaryotic-like serine/threonine-protein kinase